MRHWYAWGVFKITLAFQYSNCLIEKSSAQTARRRGGVADDELEADWDGDRNTIGIVRLVDPAQQQIHCRFRDALVAGGDSGDRRSKVREPIQVIETDQGELFGDLDGLLA